MDSINVEDQFNKENSVLSTYQDLIKFRRKFKSAILMGTCDVQEKVFNLETIVQCCIRIQKRTILLKYQTICRTIYLF